MKSFSFDGFSLKIVFENKKTYQSFMGGLFEDKYAAYFGFLVAEIEYRIHERLNVSKLENLTWNEMWEIKDELVRRIKENDFITETEDARNDDQR